MTLCRPVENKGLPWRQTVGNLSVTKRFGGLKVENWAKLRAESSATLPPYEKKASFGQLRR